MGFSNSNNPNVQTIKNTVKQQAPKVQTIKNTVQQQAPKV